VSGRSAALEQDVIAKKLKAIGFAEDGTNGLVKRNSLHFVAL
jgi:hypothetical protein